MKAVSTFGGVFALPVTFGFRKHESRPCVDSGGYDQNNTNREGRAAPHLVYAQPIFISYDCYILWMHCWRRKLDGSDF